MENIFNTQIYKSANEHSIEAPAESWNIIALTLHKKRKRTFIYWLFPILFLLASFLGGLLINNKKNNQNQNANKNYLSNDTQSRLITKINFIRKNYTLSKKFSLESYKTKEPHIVFTNDALEEIVIKRNNNIEFNKKQKINVTMPEQLETLINIGSEVIKEETNESLDIKKEDIVSIEKKTITSDTFVKNLNKIKNHISKIDSNSETNKPVVKQIRKKTNLINIQVSYEKLYVNKNNLLNLFSLKKQNNNTPRTYSSSASGIGVRPNSNKDLIYQNGKTFSISLIYQKENTRKIKFQTGINVSSSNFLINAYQANPINISNNANGIFLDSSNNNSNSTYSSIVSLPNFRFATTVKSNYYNLGILLGLNFNLFKIGKSNPLKFQTQIISSLLINKNIYLYNSNNNRYFLNKSATNTISVNQNLALLFYNNKNKYSIGGVYTFMYNDLNKKITNLSNINTSSFGLQLAYTINSKK